MSYHQLTPFNQSKAGKTPGSCLANSRQGFSIKAKYANAWSAWNHTQQHSGQPPTGVDVPVFFSYVDANHGHIGVRLANGKFWSDGNTYASIEAYTKGHAPKYVGWGESINDIRVLEKLPDAPVYNHDTSIRINSGSWNVRTAPNTSASVIGGGKAPALGGQTYGATIGTDGWAQIEFTGKIGYIGPKGFTRI